MNNKIVIIVAGAVIAALAVLAVMSMPNGTTTVTGASKLDQSREVKSNVGDKTIGGDNTQLEGVSVGGDFNLDQSSKK